MNDSLAEAPRFLDSLSYPIVELEAPYIDGRGAIQNLTTTGAQSVAIIRSVAGTERASHIHKTDDHLAMVVSGQIEYYWQEVFMQGDEILARVGEVKRVVVEAGQSFYTPKHVAHTMYFPVDTVFVTLACKARDHASHEADLIRVPSLRAGA